MLIYFSLKEYISYCRILKEREDDEIEKALHLEDTVKKKKGGCCSWCLSVLDQFQYSVSTEAKKLWAWMLSFFYLANKSQSINEFVVYYNCCPELWPQELDLSLLSWCFIHLSSWLYISVYSIITDLHDDWNPLF